jgi:hypothetical protein
MDPLKSFAAILTGGFAVKFASITVDPAIESFVESVSRISPIAALGAVIMVLLFAIEDIRVAYKAGFCGMAILSFQFMPLSWVIWIWVAGILLGFIVDPIVERLVNPGEK